MIRVIAFLLFVLPGVVLAQNPNPPIYGERDAKTGSVRLNRDWAQGNRIRKSV